MNLQTMLDKAVAGDQEAYVALGAMFGHQELKIVDLGNKNGRLCEGIRDVLRARDFRVRVGDDVQLELERVLRENEFVARP